MAAIPPHREITLTASPRVFTGLPSAAALQLKSEFTNTLLDNADTLEIVKTFLPNHYQGSVLLTSRAQTFDTLYITDPVELDVLTAGEALNFFKARTKHETLLPAEAQAAQELAAELGFFPLALEQAGTYIFATRTPFQKYLTRYRARHLDTLERKKPVAGDYQGTVATTWLMNFEYDRMPGIPLRSIPWLFSGYPFGMRMTNDQ